MVDKFWMICRENGGCVVERYHTKEEAKKAAQTLALSQGVAYHILELVE